MPHVFELQSRCTCGRDVPLRDCCSTGDRIMTPMVETKVPDRATSSNNPKCYASGDGKCCDEISREHVMSRGVLATLADGGDLVAAYGKHWVTEEGSPTNMSIGSLAARVLCTAHNHAPSNLDAAMTRVAQHLALIDSVHDARRGADVCSINGHDLERWMMKVCCGALASRNLPGAEECDRDLPAAWLDVLFGSAVIRRPAGLYVIAFAWGETVHMPVGFLFRAITSRRSDRRESAALDAFVLTMHGLRFLLVMPDREADPSELPPSRHIFRPVELRWWMPDRLVSVVLSWPDHGDGTIDVTRGSKATSPPSEVLHQRFLTGARDDGRS